MIEAGSVSYRAPTR